MVDAHQHPHDHRHGDEPDRPEHVHSHSHGHAQSHGHGHGHAHAPGGRDWAEFGARLEREGELARPIHDRLVDAIRTTLDGRHVRRILDLGSGPGVATTLLAETFPGSHATAVDTSVPLLDLASTRAARLGLGDRVGTAVADLEGSLDALAADGPAEVVWASMVLHHVAALTDTLAEIRRLIAPGGVLALVEFGDARGSIPSEAIPERPGFVDRISDLVQDALRSHLPPGALEIDWPTVLADAGFDVTLHEQVVVSFDAPLTPEQRQVAKQSFEMPLRLGLRRLDDLDLLAIARLLDDDHPLGAMRRDDLTMRLGRTVVVARRP